MIFYQSKKKKQILHCFIKLYFEIIIRNPKLNTPYIVEDQLNIYRIFLTSAYTHKYDYELDFVVSVRQRMSQIPGR